MKLLHIISSVDPAGGGPIEGIFAISEVWTRLGHDSHVLCLNSSQELADFPPPIKTFAVGLRLRSNATLRRLFPWLRYGYTPGLTRWLASHARQYEAIIIHGLWNYASYGAWRILRKLSVPYYVFTHGMLDPWFNQRYPIKTFFKTLYWKAVEFRVLRDAHSVLFTCEQERLLASESFAPYIANERVVGFGARDVGGDPAIQKSAFASTAVALNNRPFILFLGRLHPKKGIDLLISAFARHAQAIPELDLVIAGPDQLGWQKDLGKLAHNLGIASRVHWPGMLTGDAKWGAFRAACFFALPSHQENFGVVVAEALALGTPVLITNKVNIWREIASDGAGIVVNDDVDDLASGLLRMRQICGENRMAVSARARSCFLEHFNLENNAINLLRQLA